METTIEVLELLIKKILQIKSDASQLKRPVSKPIQSVIKPPVVSKLPGINQVSKKNEVKVVEQKTNLDTKTKESQKQTAKSEVKPMVKNDQEHITFNELGQWELHKSEKIEGQEGEELEKEEYDMHEWDNKTGYKSKLSSKSTSKEGLMGDSSYAREDKQPHKSWGDFVTYHKSKGFAPKLTKVTPK